MKKTLLFIAFLFVAGCTTWHITSGENPLAVQADIKIQNDAYVLGQNVSLVPKPQFNATNYSSVNADISSARLVYTDSAMEVESDDQLKQIADLVNIVRFQDSIDGNAYLIGSLVQKLNYCDSALVATEIYKGKISQ